MLEDQNFVTHNHSHQRDEAEDGGQTECTVHESQADECSRYHQCESSHTYQCDAVLLEVEEQEEEHDNHCNRDTADNLRHGLVAVFYLTAHLAAHALRQLDILLHDAGNLLFDGSGIYSLCKLCSNCDATLTATMQDAALTPFGLYFRYLAQRNGTISVAHTSAKHGHGRRNAQVLDVGVGHVGIVFHNDGQFVIALPYLSDAQVARCGCQGQCCRCAGDAELRRRHRVEFHIDNRVGLQVVGMHPFQLRHLSHALHQPLRGHVQRVEVVAIETILKFAHLQIVKSLELHVGFGECLAQTGLVLSQQVEGGILALGIDDELRIVGTSHLGCVGIHETWRRTSYKACDTYDALILLQNVLHGVGNQFRLGHSLAVRQENLNGKLITVGVGEETYLQCGYNDC